MSWYRLLISQDEIAKMIHEVPYIIPCTKRIREPLNSCKNWQPEQRGEIYSSWFTSRFESSSTMPKKKRNPQSLNQISQYIVHLRQISSSLAPIWLIMTYHYSTRRELPHSRCTWLAPHILQGLCCVIQKLHRVNVSLSLSLRMTIVFISLPTSLLFKYKENNISIRKFWVTRIIVTVDSSSFLLIMLSFTLGKFALLLLFFQNKKLECQKRMSLWTFCGKE